MREEWLKNLQTCMICQMGMIFASNLPTTVLMLSLLQDGTRALEAVDNVTLAFQRRP